MIKKILMLLLPVLGLVGGTAAGALLAPQKPEVTEVSGDGSADGEAAAGAEAGADSHGAAASEGGHGDSGGDARAAWFTFPNQFFIPVVRRDKIEQMMVLTLSIETTEAAKPDIEAQEHRLRDALLRSLIVHANTGGFTGNFTAQAKLDALRESLLKAAVQAAGPDVHAVLIEDIAEAGT